MKIVNTTKLLVLRKVETQGIKDPSKTYYSLVIMQDADAGSVNCSKDIYDSVKENEVTTFVTEYNQQYESFKIVDIVPTSNGKQS